jgi:prephenate dehydrogenase
MRIETLTVVGVGLLGGSVALAARRRDAARRIIGVDEAPIILERARQLGLVDEATPDLAEGARQADLMVFCTPVDRIAEQVLAAAGPCRPGTLLTDVGSTKAEIVRKVEAGLPAEVTFLGGHPLAGSHKSGPDHASADLFQDRLVVLTPTPRTPVGALQRLSEFWQRLGARVRLMSAEEHDQAVALTSHLPHLLASALAGILPPQLAELVASGFRDTTRLAASLPALWQGIFLSNREALLEALQHFEDQIQSFRQALVQGDGKALQQLLRQGKVARDSLSP